MSAGVDFDEDNNINKMSYFYKPYKLEEVGPGPKTMRFNDNKLLFSNLKFTPELAAKINWHKVANQVLKPNGNKEKVLEEFR